MLARLAILYSIGAGLLVYLGYYGTLSILWQFDTLHSLPLFGLLIVLGSALAAFGKWSDVEWLGDSLPSVGLVATVLGMLFAMQTALINGGLVENKETLSVHLIGALVANMAGMVGYLWLRIVRKVCNAE